MSTMLQFKVTIVDSRPPIWRRLVLDPRLTLEQFHKAIQIAFDWQDCHLHAFIAGDGARYGKPRSFDGFDHEMISESRVLLGDLFTRPRTKLRYIYDFGDDWIHDIVFEGAVESETIDYPSETFIEAGRGVFGGRKRPAMCIAGERAGPPEDCGGIHGYHDLLALFESPADALTDDDHERLQWLHESTDLSEFRPDYVDLATINQFLGRIRVKKAHENADTQLVAFRQSGGATA